MNWSERKQWLRRGDCPRIAKSLRPPVSRTTVYRVARYSPKPGCRSARIEKALAKLIAGRAGVDPRTVFGE